MVGNLKKVTHKGLRSDVMKRGTARWGVFVIHFKQLGWKI